MLYAGVHEYSLSSIFKICLRQHRTIWQEHSAKDFASYESYKRAGILYVFPPFITARMGQKIGRRPQTQLCGAALIKAVREQCSKARDWHAVRDWIEAEHGYDRYPGSCPMVTNHLVVLLAFIMGGESFTESVMIATSAGWDTDCNAGNVGCLNGIRLGLEGLEADGNLRKPIADRMYVVTADGGSCVTDAVIETRKLIEAAYRLDGQCYEPPKARYAFEFPGSVQGFVPYGRNTEEQTLVSLHNAMARTGRPGLVLEYNGLSKGYHASACADTFVDLKPKGAEGTSYYDVVASPSLYSGQEITVSVRCEQEENPDFQLFFDYFNVY